MSAARRCLLAVVFAMFAGILGVVASEANAPVVYGQLPLSFEANQGQTHPSVGFVARNSGYQLFLMPTEAALVLRRPGAAAPDTLRMSLVGAIPGRPLGVDPLPGTANYLRGNDPARWHTSIPTYAKVLARGVYPGVDVLYYGNQRQLEYDFIVAAGADPAAIRLGFRGLAASGTQPAIILADNGDLTLRIRGGDVSLKRPVAYQEDEKGARHQVSVAFDLVAARDSNDVREVRFRVGAYDRSRPLVIDPVLSYSMYLGGTGEDAGMAIAVSGTGEAYVTGYTDSLNFPGGTNQPGRDAFVAKVNAAGSGLDYSTYLGGNGDDAAMGIAVDSAGRAYITGYTDSTDFPTFPAAPLYGDQGGRDAFVTVLETNGTTLVYSTYLGGGGSDTGLGIAVDSSGKAYVTGWTDSIDFPTTSSKYQGEQAGRDAFVTVLSGVGPALFYSTYLGGALSDEGHAIAVDALGNVHVTGSTTSTDFPKTANGRQQSLLGTQDAFLTSLNPTASGTAALIYSTYFGGAGVEVGLGIAVDTTNLVYITGSTTSATLSTMKCSYQAAGGGGQDAFFAKFNTAAGTGASSSLVFSSFLGGTGEDTGLGIAVDEEFQVYVAGSTASANFPKLWAAYPSLSGAKDAFVAKFDAANTCPQQLRYSTYVGGSGADEGYGVGLDAAGNAYVVGLTQSTDFPGAIGNLGGSQDAFVAKLSEPDLLVSALTLPATAGAGGAISVTDTTKNTGIAPADASITKFYLSTDNKLNPAVDTFLGSRPVPALTPGQEDTATTELTMPSPLAPATYFLFAQADADDAVGESFEGNNKTKKTIVVGPDLSVTAVSSTGSGLTVTVTDTTKNVGGASVGVPTTTQFFLVPSSGPPVLLGSRTVGALAAGAESTASTDLTIPAGTTAGSYTILVRADGAGALVETDETNNEKTAAFAVGVDLVVSAFTVPGTSGAGVPFNVTPTILNQGAIASGITTTEFFLSTTTSIDATAVSIGTQPAPALAPGATSAVATSLTIPAGTAAGSYFIIAKANSVAPLIAETSATNNTRAKSSLVGPDLRVSFVFPASAAVAPGGTVTFKETIKNYGGGPAGASLTKFYLSTDATYDASDTELGFRSVPTLEPGAQDANVAGTVLTIPAATAGGSYFIITRANAGASVTETDTTNNTSATPLAVGGVDLVVSALTASFNGTTITINDTTKNQGTDAAGDSTTTFYFSTDSTLEEATDRLLGSRSVGGLAAGATSDGTSTFSLPAGTPPGAYFIFAKANSGATPIAESDTTNNKRRANLDTAQNADLVVTLLTFSWNAADGTLNITDTTRNDGTGVAGGSITRFYLSTDATYDAGDSSLGSRSVVTLAPANQSTTTTVVTIPATTAAGSYFLIARADDGSTVGESNETNNTKTSDPITIRPDLTIDALTVPGSAGAGVPFTVSVTVKNGGPIPAPASAVKLYRSTDTTVDASDTVLATLPTPALGANKTDTASISVTLADDTPAGTFFVIAKADGDDQVLESSETNNTKNRPIAIGADLVISAFSGPAAGGAGGTITVNDTTRNQVTTAAPASTTQFYLSTNSSLDAGDVLIGSRSVPALGSKKTNAANTTLNIPAGTAAGNYFIIAVANGDHTVIESTEANNTASAPIIIGADLVVSALGVPATVTGSTITVTDTTTNQGGSVAGASKTKFYLSTNTTWEPTDVLLSPSRLIGSLDAAAGSSGPTILTIPGSTPAGAYYIIARADADGEVSEVNEINNARTSDTAILIGPDLVASLSLPATAVPGATIKISNTVSNIGGAQAGTSAVTFVLSTGAVLGSRTVPALDAGASSSEVTNVTLPSDLPAGAFSVTAQADANSQVTEANEANNTSAPAPLKTAPDLQVTVLTGPAEAAPGAVITIKDTTKNLGAAALPSVTRFYWSTDAIYDAGDTRFIPEHAVPALAFGAASLGSTDLTLPSGLSAGTYYIIARADATDAMTEAVEDNNTRVHVIKIGADFIISAVTAPTESGAGKQITVGASTKNQGAATGASVTHFYLSSDDTLSGEDKFLGSLDVAALGANVTKTGSISVTLPNPLPAAPGQYFIIAKANGNGAVSETDSGNNTKARSIVLGPDLVVSALTVQTSGGAGLPFTINDTTRNDGAGDAPSSTTSYYLSTDTVLDATDRLIGSRTVPLLAPGASSVGNVTVTLPADLAGGTYQVIAIANTGGVPVPELNNGNNTRSKQTKIGPDLVVSTLAAPVSTTAGSTITVTATIANQGAGDAGTFTVRVYLSGDEFVSGGDSVVGSVVINGGVKAGASSLATPISVQIPAGTAPGPFVLIVVADATGAITELSEVNNQKTRSLNVVP